MWDNNGLVTAMEKVDRLFPASQLVDLSEQQPCGPIAAKRVLETTYTLLSHGYELHELPKLASIAYRMLLMVSELGHKPYLKHLEAFTKIDKTNPVYFPVSTVALRNLYFTGARDVFISGALDERISLTVDRDRLIKSTHDFVLLAGVALIHMAHHAQSADLPAAFDLLSLGVELISASDEMLFIELQEGLDRSKRSQEASFMAKSRHGDAPALWRKAVIEQFKKKAASVSPYKTIPKAAEDMANQELTVLDDDGNKLQIETPGYRTVENFLRQAKKEGEI